MINVHLMNSIFDAAMGGKPCTSKTLLKLKRRYPNIISHITDETKQGGSNECFPRQGDGYWIYLKPGYICESLECHFVHEWTVKDCLEAFKSVKPCHCNDCKEMKG